MSLCERAQAKIIEKVELAYPDGGPRSPEFAGKIYKLRKGDAVNFAPIGRVQGLVHQPELAAALSWLHEEAPAEDGEGGNPLAR